LTQKLPSKAAVADLAHVRVDEEQTQHEKDGAEAALEQRKADGQQGSAHSLLGAQRQWTACGCALSASIVVVGDVGGEIDREADGHAGKGRSIFMDR